MSARAELKVLILAITVCGCDPACPNGTEMVAGRCREIVDANVADANVRDSSVGDAASGVDAGLDSGATDAGPPPEPTHVQIRQNGSVAAGITVVFHAPDGAIVDTVSTNGAGRAESRARDIDGITAVVPNFGDLGRHLFTVLGLGPGQTTTLVLDEPMVERISVPSHAQSASFVISDGYQQSTWQNPVDGQPFAVLPISGTGAVTVFALDSSGVASAHTRELSFGLSTSIRELPAWSTTFDTHSYSMTGAGSASSVFAEVYGDHEGRDILIGRGVAETLRVAPGFPGTIRIARGVAITSLGPTSSLARAVSSVHTDMPTSFQFDLTRAPTVASVSPSHSGSRFEIAWSANEEAADALEVRLVFLEGGVPIDWRIIAPPDRAPVGTPDLPDLLASFRPPADGRIAYSLELVDYDEVSGYETIRAEPLTRRRASATGSAFDVFNP